jgi:hypothetical protein
MNGRTVRGLGAVVLGCLLCLQPSCEKKVDQKVEYGPRVSGKVTYKGEPVPYGMVLFYSHGKAVDPKSGQIAPAATARISADGSYEVSNAPVGPVMVCVATDPDVDLVMLTAPSGFGATGGGPPMAGGGPPMAGGGPPMGGGPPIGGSGPPMPGGGPPMAGGPPMPGGLPKLPKDVGKPSDPATEKLTDAQKKTLKEIHEKYSKPGKSPLNHAFPAGEASVTYDVALK